MQSERHSSHAGHAHAQLETADRGHASYAQAGPHHGGHGHMMHEASAETLAAYQYELAAARPAPGGKLVTVELEARETSREFIPGQPTVAWGWDRERPGARRAG